MFPLWFTLLCGSFVFLDVGPSILFLLFTLFSGCFFKFVIWQGFMNNKAVSITSDKLNLN